MSKLVKVNVLDEATKLPTGETEEVLMTDEIENLINQGVFATDDEGIFFQRQLEYIQAQSYDVLYPELKGRTCFALNTEGGEGINQITYRSYDKRGEAVIISGKATDLPRADVDGKEYTINVRTIGTAYGYSRQEIAASKVTGFPLDARKAEAARRAYEEKVNQVIWFGSEDDGISGLFAGVANDPWDTITNTAVANAAAGTNSKVWGVDKTPDEVIADLTTACSNLWTSTKMIHSPNKILISPAKYLYLMNTPRSLQSDVSILDWFLKNNQFITSKEQFVVVNELVNVFGATPGPAGGSEGFVVMQESADNLRVRETFPLVHLPVQYKGLEFEINTYGRFAGLEIIRPAAIQFYYGI